MNASPHHVLRILLLAIVGSSTWVGAIKADELALPHELAVAEQEANEALFDGDYDEAVRLSEKALKWLREGDHRLVIAKLGHDWSTREALIKCLQGQAYYRLGEETRAQAALRSAAKQLQPRRLYWQKAYQASATAKEEERRQKAKESALEVANYILYDAMITMTLGETQSPVPDFGVTDLVDRETLSLYRKIHGDSGKAGVCFRAARDQVLLIEGGLRDLGGEDALPADAKRLYRRCKLKLMVTFARLECWARESGEALDQHLRDADDLLNRADNSMARDDVWQLFISPDSFFSIRYSDLDELKQQQGNGGGNPQGGVNVTDVIELKQLLAQTTDDYFAIMMARAEVAERRESVRPGAGDGNKAWAPENAERWYQQAMLFSRSQFPPRHPVTRQIEVSKARWYATRSQLRGGANIAGNEVRQRVSMARDCINLVRRAQLADEGRLVKRERLELGFLEIRAIQNLLDIHDKVACFQPHQIAGLKARKDAVTKTLEDIARPMIAKAAQNNPP